MLSLTTALYAALLSVELINGAGEAASAAGWVETLLESAISAALIAGCFFLYVREHKRVAALYDTAESESRRSQRLEAILSLGNELRAASSADEVARVAANAVERTLAFNENALYLLDADDSVFYTAASSGAYPDYDAQVRDKRIPLRVVRGLLRPEFRRGQCYFIDHRVYAMSDEETFFFPNGPVPDRGRGTSTRTTRSSCRSTTMTTSSSACSTSTTPATAGCRATTPSSCSRCSPPSRPAPS